jgi:hypothetical protein
MYVTALSSSAGREMETPIAGVSKVTCDLARNLEVAGEEAPLGSIHNLATGVREEGTAWPSFGDTLEPRPQSAIAITTPESPRRQGPTTCLHDG